MPPLSSTSAVSSSSSSEEKAINSVTSWWTNLSQNHRSWLIGGIAVAAVGVHWVFAKGDKLSTQLGQALGSLPEPSSKKSRIRAFETSSPTSADGSHAKDDNDIQYIGESIGTMSIKQVQSMGADATGKWLKLLKKTFYVSNTSEETYDWEYCQRTTSTVRAGSTSKIDGVEIIAITHRRGSPHKLVLIANARPPVERGVIEFPSGIIDPGEKPEEAAVRELREETGLKGVVRHVGPTTFVDPWKSTEAYAPVFMEIDEEDPVNKDPQPSTETDEQIQVLLVPLHNSWQHIQNAAQHFNYALESKVASFAQGQYFANAVEPLTQLMDESFKIQDLLQYERSESHEKN